MHLGNLSGTSISNYPIRVKGLGVSAPERQLRILQAVCVLVLIVSSRLALRVQGTTHGSTTVQWIFFALGLLCAVDGFVLPSRRQSTPFKRWRAGNIVRLQFGSSVGLSGLCVGEFGGPAWQVDLLLALGLILLMIWKPSPNPQDPAPMEQSSGS